MNLDATKKVLIDVVTERQRQNAKWGQQDVDPLVWLSILMEEVGELATAMIEGQEVTYMRTEAVQVAAVAVQFVEYLDRREGNGE